MAKIMNLQMPGTMSVSTQTSGRVSSSDAGDGFLQMLQQKQEASAADQKKDPTASVKDAASDTKEEAEPKEVPAEDEEPTEDVLQLAQELAAQQAAVQQTVVTPDWQEQQAVQPEIAVEAAVELPAETVKPAVNVTEQAETPVSGQAEEVQRPAEDLIPQQTVQEVTPKEDQPEASLSGNTTPSPAKADAPKEPVREAAPEPVREEVSKTSEEEPEAVYSPNTQSPVPERTQTFVKEPAAEGTTMKATVEEFPEEVGKALSSGRLTDSQTLTVELEPVSLGKLTIRVDYEAGRAAVSILSSNPKTLEILSEKASEIASILKEHTGEETVIYTQEAQPEQDQDQYDGSQGGSRGEQEEQRQQKEEDHHEAESFAQQLRLGLV